MIGFDQDVLQNPCGVIPFCVGGGLAQTFDPQSARNRENSSFSKTIRLIASINDLRSPYNMRILNFRSSNLH